MIEFDHISVDYDDHHQSPRRVLNDIALCIRPGESVAIMGANGSGKSTLVKCINGLILPGAGKVRVDGLDTADASQILNIRKRVGMLFQNPDNQIVSATVEREIAFGLENLGMAPMKMRERVEQALAQFDLTRYRRKSPHYLSGGEKQRLALAAVMAMRPHYLVLDEPTSLLDPKSRREMLNLISDLRGGEPSGKKVTTILVTQFPDEVVSFRRLIVLQDGRVFWDGPPAEIFKEVEKLSSIGLEPPMHFQLKRLLDEK